MAEKKENMELSNSEMNVDSLPETVKLKDVKDDLDNDTLLVGESVEDKVDKVTVRNKDYVEKMKENSGNVLDTVLKHETKELEMEIKKDPVKSKLMKSSKNHKTVNSGNVDGTSDHIHQVDKTSVEARHGDGC